jgi:hypothetical protein
LNDRHTDPMGRRLRELLRAAVQTVLYDVPCPRLQVRGLATTCPIGTEGVAHDRAGFGPARLSTAGGAGPGC